MIAVHESQLLVPLLEKAEAVMDAAAMTSKEDEKRWRTALKDRGVTDVAILLNHIEPLKPEAPVPSVGDREPWPSRAFVANWLRKQEAATLRKGTWILAWTIVAALAAVVAAWQGFR
jgi:hypothetical protein